ncbi:hypothetical protein [Paracoccus sp. UBA5162]|nr:hypothetical protein [Paracoccus sp. UBA5162]
MTYTKLLPCFAKATRGSHNAKYFQITQINADHRNFSLVRNRLPSA